jgi:hypothetical protein
VYLHTKNLRTKRLSKGLDNVKVGLFLISKRNGLVTYTLELPLDAKIYPRFYVSLLEPADLETLLQKRFCYETEEDNVFEVERIVAYKGMGLYEVKHYLVKWKGYLDSENTWELEYYLQNCQERIRQYN